MNQLFSGTWEHVRKGLYLKIKIREKFSDYFPKVGL
jgi:hypothetical protein